MRTTLRLAAAAMLTIGTAFSASAAIRTDIVFVVDESGSMGSVQANLRNNIGAFANILSGGGVDATYALVGYGNAQVAPRILTNFTDPTTFATAAQGLQISGGTEPGYTAIAFALNGIDNQANTLNYRANSLKNIILLTDEPSNGDFGQCSAGRCVGGVAANATNVDTLLKDNDALLNSVLSTFPTGSTVNSYGALTTNNGGIVFNLSLFGSSNPAVVEAFVQDFATRKLQEIIDTCDTNPNLPGCTPSTGVPEPGTLALLGAGLFGLGMIRRRRAAA
jgi:hypothetical protein